MEYELFNVAEAQKKNPLCIKIDPKTKLSTVSLGVAYLRDICRGLQTAKQNKDRDLYHQLHARGEEYFSADFFSAFEKSYCDKLEILNFDYIIFETNVETTINDCRSVGIFEFTISAAPTIEMWKKLFECGCKVVGMAEVKKEYGNIPAIKFEIEGN